MPTYADLYQTSLAKPVDASSNAKMHNNLGTMYFNNKDYFAAIKEYRIAIGINPNSQATAIYFNNLGKTYLVLGKIQKRNGLPLRGWDDFSKMAVVCFEEAISKDCMKLEYYENMVEAYELTGQLHAKKNYFLANKDEKFNIIPAAIILKKLNEEDYANMLLDDFISKNPNIIITDDLKKIIEK